MNEIIEIVMENYDMTREEATNLINETKDEINEVIESGDYTEAQDILMDNLGLEPDFLFDLI